MFFIFGLINMFQRKGILLANDYVDTHLANKSCWRRRGYAATACCMNEEKYNGIAQAQVKVEIDARAQNMQKLKGVVN